MREALTPERLRSRHACARLLSRDMKCQNSEKADKLKSCSQGRDEHLETRPLRFSRPRSLHPVTSLLVRMPYRLFLTQSFVLDYSAFLRAYSISIDDVILLEIVKCSNANNGSIFVLGDLPSTPDEHETN